MDDFPYGTPKSRSNQDGTARLNYLRTHGDYLAPDNQISIWSLAAVVVRTLFLNLAVWLPLGAGALYGLTALFRAVDPKQFSWLPNFFSFLIHAGWQGECKKCVWQLEVFYGLCTLAALCVCAAFAAWATAFALDTRISPKQDASPRPLVRVAYGAGALLCVPILYFAFKKLVYYRSADPFLFSIVLLLAAATIFCAILFVLQARKAELSANYRWRRAFERIAGRVSPWTLILFAVGSLPVVPYLLINHAGPFSKVIVGLLGGLSGVFSAVAGHNAQGQEGTQSEILRWFLMFASAVFLYSMGMLAYVIAEVALEPSALTADASQQNLIMGVLLAAVAIALVMAWRTNVNYVGLHRFYRDRLMEAFMPAPKSVLDDVIEVSPGADRLSLSELWVTRGERRYPYPILNANAIMINDRNRKLSWRGGDNFIMSPLFVGSTATGWERTERHVAKNGPLSLASAMAASGAAFNANAAYVGAGVTRDRLLSIVMVLLNLRLGMWVGRPSQKGRGIVTHEPNHVNPGLRYGLTRAGYSRNSAFVELTDGGHFDNLGVYELVRREVSLIVAIDGEEDPTIAMPALYSVVNRVREDFQTTIDLDKGLEDLVPTDAPGYPSGAKLVKSPFVVAPIRYPSGKEGTLLYIKLCLAPAIGFVARGYRAQNTSFPHQPTTNQFFVPEQIDAYLEIGYVNAGAALDRLAAVRAGVGTMASTQPST